MDVARALYLDLIGNEVLAGQVRDGRKWLVEDCDIGSSLCYRKDGKLSFLRWVTSLSGVKESAYFAFDDLTPFWDMCVRSFMTWSRSTSIFRPKSSPRSSSRIYAEETRLLSGAIKSEP